MPAADSVNQALLDEANQKIRRAHTAINALLIVKNGTPAYSRVYRQGDTLATPQPVYSVTKSVISALIGCAIAAGKIDSVEQPLCDLLNARITKLGISPDADACQLTLHQLLSMSAGFPWRDGRMGNEPMLARMLAKRDWAEFVLRLPVQKNQLGRFQYNSAISHLLSIILSDAVGVRADEFANDTLFGPLGISNYHWQCDPQGYNTGGWGLHLSASDMAKIGMLYLHQGRWQNHQLIPHSWVSASTTVQVAASDHASGYGYQWWLTDADGCKAFYALGLGGQFIYCIPQRNAIIVVVSNRAGRRRPLWPLFEQFFLPAVR